VLDLVRLLGVGQSVLSYQLRLLRDNRVVARRKAGRVAYHRLSNQRIRAAFTEHPAPTSASPARPAGWPEPGPPSGHPPSERQHPMQ
jgi:hypothetical protein